MKHIVEINLNKDFDENNKTSKYISDYKLGENITIYIENVDDTTHQKIKELEKKIRCLKEVIIEITIMIFIIMLFIILNVDF